MRKICKMVVWVSITSKNVCIQYHCWVFASYSRVSSIWHFYIFDLYWSSFIIPKRRLKSCSMKTLVQWLLDVLDCGEDGFQVRWYLLQGWAVQQQEHHSLESDAGLTTRLGSLRYLHWILGSHPPPSCCMYMTGAFNITIELTTFMVTL